MENGGSSFVVLFRLALVLLTTVAIWRVYAKAGEPGWACIIPIYNLYILLRIAERPGWWLLLFFIPVVNVIVDIIVSIDVANRFGRGVAFGIGLAFLPFIFYPIIAFSGN